MHQKKPANKNGWLMGYLLLLAIHLLAILADWELVRFITKPLLMAWLLVYFISVTPPGLNNRVLVLAALFFSWLGDIFLMQSAAGYFMAGLGAFFIAQLLYCWIFWRIRKQNLQKENRNWPVLIGVVIYIILLYGWLFQHLPSELKWPVFGYALAIGSMLILAVHSAIYPLHFTGRLLITGAGLFVVSDSLLAINQFVQPFALASVAIMLTYGLAQLLIIHAIARIK